MLAFLLSRNDLVLEHLFVSIGNRPENKAIYDRPFMILIEKELLACVAYQFSHIFMLKTCISFEQVIFKPCAKPRQKSSQQSVAGSREVIPSFCAV